MKSKIFLIDLPIGTSVKEQYIYSCYQFTKEEIEYIESLV